MKTSRTRTKLFSAAVAGAAAPVLLCLAAGTAQAIPDVGERGAVAIIDNLPTPRDCAKCQGFDPQPDPPGLPETDGRLVSAIPMSFRR
jgi:hypothetical protein